jgi:adenosine kinase
MATVGEDFSDYREWLDSNGVETSLMQVIPGQYTASFFATTDRSNAQIASFYPGAMGEAAQQSIQIVNPRPNLVVVSPNAPDAMTKFAEECRNLQLPYLYDPSQQILRLEGKDLIRDMTGANFLFVNDYESGLITKKTGWDLKEILKHVCVVVITRGKDGANVFDGDKEYFIPPVPDRGVVDPTGVGDAFRGGFLAGYANGFDWVMCGKMGSLAAVYCLEQKGPQKHKYSKEEFIARFREHYDDNKKLKVLLG